MSVPSCHVWPPGWGNPAGRLPGSRNKLNEEVICALFRKHEEKAIGRYAASNPECTCDVSPYLIPREHKVEHSNAIEDLRTSSWSGPSSL